MTQTSRTPGVSRRGFMKGAAGLSFAIGAPGIVAACGNGRPLESLARFEPNVWATIATDGKITVQVPAAEMGQGPMTSLPLIFAEELDADWADIIPVQVTELKKEYGNWYFGGLIYTGGSMAVAAYYMPLRRAGAQARRILIEAAAGHWRVPPGELDTEPSLVVHQASGRRLSYGEIAGFAQAPETIPEIADAELKEPKDFRLIGRDVPRLDGPLKVSGAAQYAMDVQVPGMVYAAILHAPVEGESPVAIDDGAALGVPGVLRVVSLGDSIAIIGQTVEATRVGKEALVVEWTGEAPLRHSFSEQSLDDYAAAANDASRAGTVFHRHGDVAAAFAEAARVVSAEYRNDYVYHAQMEPLNATAQVNAAGDGAEIWCGTQAQSLTIMTAAKTLGTTPDKIKLNQLYLGGGFGRRAELKPAYLIEALRLSRRLGKPVKVIWSREDDLRSGWFRPATAQVLRAGLDGDGNVVAWHHRLAGPSVLEFYNNIRWNMTGGVDGVSMYGSENTSYGMPNKLVEHIVMARGARLAPWRGVGTGYTKFAVESFVDELAEAQGEDPVEFRLRRLNLTGRARNVLEAVAEASDWGSPRRAGRALGVSLVEYHASVAAGVFEISVDRANGKISVHKVWVAADPGLAVQPLNVEMQLEGALVYGIGQALTERVTVEAGMVQQSNFHDYEVMRMADVPDMHIQVFSTDNPPSGVGELALPLTGGGIANAFKALTGIRLRHMPLTRERVLDALKA